MKTRVTKAKDLSVSEDNIQLRVVEERPSVTAMARKPRPQRPIDFRFWNSDRAAEFLCRNGFDFVANSLPTEDGTPSTLIAVRIEKAVLGFLTRGTGFARSLDASFKAAARQWNKSLRAAQRVAREEAANIRKRAGAKR